ncbi:unannotated protein [freshwater metagenome]|uniref:Unannotated protein n=1 Tax=freshwater metagenome TaxID=449393 RepID=A0A6J6IYQ9_9ZZZZ|nr:UDP-N-acetylmuramoyl-L-alanyl-D-glutamate--2,6-diaminopimelate ligase [Actinomycetota bacterium]MSZ41992.1 UDP-N-acetylmuramoyl-L-alanyl-D-glutamate--2,6-diaminopimelate ligase [Actinomycetota bacterium]
MADHANDQRTSVTLASFLELGIPQLKIYGDAATNITGIELDSRVIDPGDLFVAIEGHQRHGVEFFDEAIARGAVAILTDPTGWLRLSESSQGFPVVVIQDARKFLGAIANLLYDRASERINILGVTGTNGKTTTATMIEAALLAAGRSTGFIGTTGIRIGAIETPSKRTTPEATTLHALFAQMGELSVTDVVMEVSSHALSEDRVGGLHYSVVGFTNLSQDHLDYHHSMEEYFQAKALLFTPQYASQAVICIDDVWGERLAAIATVPVTTISITGKAADWKASLNFAGEIEITGPQDQSNTFTLLLPGDFNRANALLAFVMVRLCEVPADVIANALAHVQVAGRLEQVAASSGSSMIRGIVDYAHTPDAVERAISAVREATQGDVIVVLGAGGDRDATKRPLMGQSAARLADQFIVTDDNPRSEDPALIRASVLEGARTVSSTNGCGLLEIADRAAAIRRAVELAHAGDVILVLGKGHEQGQEINGVVTPFDDRLVLNRALELKNGGLQ